MADRCGGLSPEKPQIDDSHVKSYKEELLGTNPIWEAYGGYVDADGYYKVSYVGDVSDGWRQGIFKNGEWKTWQMPAISDQGPDYNFFGGRDDRLWYYSASYDDVSDAQLKVYNEKSKLIGEIDMFGWMKKNGMKNKTIVDVTTLSGTLAIFEFKDEEDHERCVLVDVSNGKIKREYGTPITGECYGDYLYDYLGSGSDILKITNWKTGEVMECLDLSGIRGEYKSAGRLIGYSKVSGGFFELENYDIPNVESGTEGIKYCVYKGTLYLSYFSGVYRYNAKEKKLEKILDGDKLPNFQKMYGDFDVGKDESIYLLGFLGGGDDEGATDFLYLTKE